MKNEIHGDVWLNMVRSKRWYNSDDDRMLLTVHSAMTIVIKNVGYLHFQPLIEEMRQKRECKVMSLENHFEHILVKHSK